MVEHKGIEMARGHYVTYVLDSNNKWILYDDEKLKEVNKDRVLNSQPYLLFYELI